jgi:hypothetical protein
LPLAPVRYPSHLMKIIPCELAHAVVIACETS